MELSVILAVAAVCLLTFFGVYYTTGTKVNNALLRQKLEQKSEAEQLQERHETELAELKQAHEAELARLEAEHTQRVEDLEGRQAARILEMEQALSRRIEEQERELAARLDEMDARIAEEVTMLRKALEHKIEKAETAAQNTAGRKSGEEKGNTVEELLKQAIKDPKRAANTYKTWVDFTENVKKIKDAFTDGPPEGE